MNKCEIRIENGVVKVDKYPKLMDSLMEYTNYNTDKAVNLYGLSLTEDYETLVQKPNDINHFLRYVKVKNIQDSKKLSDVDYVYLNLSLNQDMDYSDFREKFISTFTDDNGLFEYDSNKLSDSLLNLDNADSNIKSIENIYYHLLGESETYDTYSSPKIFRNGINIDENLHTLKLEYTGAETKEQVIKRAIELEDSDVLDNEDIQNWIVDFNSNKQMIQSVYTTVEGDLIPSTDSVYNRLNVAFDISQDFSNVKTSIEYIVENIEELSLTENIDDLENYFKHLENSLLNKGFPVKGLSDKLLDSNIETTQNYLGSLYNMLEDMESFNENINDSVYEFSMEHEMLFGANNKERFIEVDKIGEDVFYLKSDLSEAEIFDRFGLISVGDNQYKLYSVSNRELSGFYEESMRDTFLDLVSEDDVESKAKSATVAKYLFGVENIPNEIDGRYYRDVTENYEDFITDFNKILVKNPMLDSMFAFTENGLEAQTEISEFSKNIIKNELSTEMYNKLQDYALISNNKSLSNLLPTFSPIFEKNNEIYRNFILNNPNNLLSLKSEYEKYGNTIVAKGVKGDFIKVSGRIYERVEGDSFVKLPKPTTKVFNVSKPILESNVKDNVITNRNIEIENGPTKIKFC